MHADGQDGVGQDGVSSAVGAELEVRRIVPASPERVFEAWTSPDALRKWWAPPGGTCSGAELDLRVGGRYRIVNLLPDSSTVVISGQFLEVTRPESLGYTWLTVVTNGRVAATDTAGPVEHVTVRFKSHDQGTEVIVSHQRIANDELRQGHELGWTSCLDGLVDHLT